MKNMQEKDFSRWKVLYQNAEQFSSSAGVTTLLHLPSWESRPTSLNLPIHLKTHRDSEQNQK